MATVYTDYHVARLLLLLEAFGGSRRRYLEGLTKLAKLDFLLRYPRALEDLLAHRGIHVDEELRSNKLELHAVESPMIRYRYGPWDQQYYSLLGRLVGIGLAEQSRAPRGTVRFRLTPHGQAKAGELANHPEWSLMAQRAQLLAAHLRDVSGNSLKKDIYALFGELLDRPYWSEIR